MVVQSLLSGFNSAQASLTSQAFGANRLHMCGVYLNRGRIIQTLSFVAIAIWPLIFGETVLVAIGIDAEVSRLAQIQMRV